MLPPKNIPVRKTYFLDPAKLKRLLKVRNSKRTMIRVFLRIFSCAVYFGNSLLEKVKKAP
jgi:hypothetical protein